jgi:hypothetical protein
LPSTRTGIARRYPLAFNLFQWRDMAPIAKDAVAGLVQDIASGFIANEGEGLGRVETHGREGPMHASWNQLASWLSDIDGLRLAA